jgi:hypothetical protein
LTSLTTEKIKISMQNTAPKFKLAKWKLSLD